ncbi:MAG: hypothetical protein U9N61_06825 [Euryarchaeota archaeon]|nr:hypothetical protein [Euryarchaeota archaeon]
MQNQGEYTWRNYRVRGIESDDVEACAMILDGKIKQASCKRIDGANGILLEIKRDDKYEIIGFATWEIETGLVSVPVGFIINYKIDQKYAGTKGSLILSLVLFHEKLNGYSIYTSGHKPDSFKKMFKEKYVHGRSNKVFRFYKMKKEAINRLMKAKEKIQWEVNMQQ